MALRLLITSSRKPGLTPEQFKEHYENHAELIKRLAGDTFPLSHRRIYIARTTTNTNTLSTGTDDATPRNATTPATVLRGTQTQFDFDATAELTFESQAAFDCFVARLQEPENAAQIEADEEGFLERSSVGIVFVGDVTETVR
ncbi:EthD domain-containing protein [Aspergillus karnatakaensis]|uniref:EthD domain-containing protein n=1 Tax=Aspergillus karnatakaensis TaxID=1810916 RepID=UPI003CCE48C6